MNESMNQMELVIGFGCGAEPTLNGRLSKLHKGWKFFQICLPCFKANS